MQVSIAINGKFKVSIEIDKNLSNEDIENLAKQQEKIKTNLEGKTIKKVIVVNSKTGKMVNFVVL